HIAFRRKALLGLVGLGLPGRKVDSYSKGGTGTVGMSNSDPEDLRNLMSQRGWSDRRRSSCIIVGMCGSGTSARPRRQSVRSAIPTSPIPASPDTAEQTANRLSFYRETVDVPLPRGRPPAATYAPPRGRSLHVERQTGPGGRRTPPSVLTALD